MLGVGGGGGEGSGLGEGGDGGRLGVGGEGGGGEGGGEGWIVATLISSRREEMALWEEVETPLVAAAELLGDLYSVAGSALPGTNVTPPLSAESCSMSRSGLVTMAIALAALAALAAVAAANSNSLLVAGKGNEELAPPTTTSDETVDTNSNVVATVITNSSATEHELRIR